MEINSTKLVSESFLFSRILRKEQNSIFNNYAENNDLKQRLMSKFKMEHPNQIERHSGMRVRLSQNNWIFSDQQQIVGETLKKFLCQK